MVTQKVLTFSSKTDRKGIYISKTQFDLLTAFILTTLRNRGEMTLPLLIEEASRELSGTFQGNLAWCLLRVKYTLEANGLISTAFQLQPHRTQVLRLSKKRTKTV